MSDWFDRAEQEISKDHDNGDLTDKEYQQAMKDLHREYDDYAHQEAQNTYDSFY
jgi:hypothetical protein